nr:DUF6249 domain-containing protein [uncultured Carboxylicivirga sp.]
MQSVQIVENIMIGLVWLAFFAGAFMAWFFYVKARNTERLALIEKGADANNFYGKKENRKSFRFPWMKFGLLISGLGFGLALGLFIISTPSLKEALDDVGPGLVFATMLLFGGIGMIVAHFVDRKKENQSL